MTLEYSTYVIKSSARNYMYVGLTNNLVRRIKEHNEGRNKTTKAYRPFVLIYTTKFATRLQAREHEKMLKSGYGKEFLKSLEK